MSDEGEATAGQAHDVADDLGLPFGRFGDVYRWLRENYDFVEGWRRGRKPTWETVAAKIFKAGVANRNGGPPAGRLVSRIWGRVCRDVKAEREREEAERAAREAKAEARRNYPSRMSPGLRPAIAEAEGRSNSALFATGSPRSSPMVEAKAVAKPWEDPRLTPQQAQHMKEQLERLDREHEWNARNVKSLSLERLAELKREFGHEEIKERLAARAKREE